MGADLPVLAPGAPFPPVESTWGAGSPAPGLLAAGGTLDVPTLRDAYRHGIFPWFSRGQPILWWSPDPRMVLHVQEFRLHDSLRKTLRRLLRDGRLQIRIDQAFATVIAQCAQSPRAGQGGTWIVPDMIHAYTALHRAGCAHSVEAWLDGELAGGLYLVSLGRMVFGESMFTRRSDASKLALAALVAFCRAHGIEQIDCQQNTGHLASLGAREVPRADFIRHVRQACEAGEPAWHFDPVYWNHISRPPDRPPSP